jgi:hypothetical protein
VRADTSSEHIKNLYNFWKKNKKERERERDNRKDTQIVN